MAKSDTLFYDQNGWKTLRFGAAHTYMAHIREHLPPPQVYVLLIRGIFTWVKLIRTYYYV